MAIMSKSSRKRHTKPCLYFQTNDCPLSAHECDFAHVIATSEQYESLKNPQATLRTKPCRFYLSGQCRDGYWCRFKHPASAFAASRESDSSLLDDVPELESDKGTDDDVDVRDLDGAWKAKPEEHPKYRTRPCRNFILGKCIYGDRCSYLHVETPPKTPTNRVFPSSIGPSPSLYLPTTPPHRAPPSTPINSQHVDSDVDVFDLDASIFKTPVRSRFNNEITPSTSSGYSEEPVTPASPPTPGVNDYSSFPRGNVPPLPLSPLSPLAYATRDYLSKMQSPLDCMTFSSPPPPLSMYSPTSPVPLRIVHVPFAVPAYQDMSSPSPTPRRISVSTQNGQPPRQRAFSQPSTALAPNQQEASSCRTKPCKFLRESGKCQKGNKCNFSHAPTSPSALVKRAPATRKEPVTSESEREESASSEISLKRETSSETKENKPNNFYKVNWRVVGGGVKIGSENNMNRRHSEDPSACLSSKNPFDSITSRLANSTSALGPAIRLNDRVRSKATVGNSQKPGFQSTKKGVDKSLMLALQAFSLAKASAASDSTSACERSIVVVQGDEDESIDQGGASSEKPTAASRYDVARAKSSPSSPVTAHHDLPNMIFSAESP